MTLRLPNRVAAARRSGSSHRLRVRTKDGAVHEGDSHYEAFAISIRTDDGKTLIPHSAISSVTVLPPKAPARPTKRRRRFPLSVTVLAVAVLALAGCRPAAPPAPAPYSGDVVALIHEAFGPLGEGDKAVRVAQCESGLNPLAVSPGGTYVGLFQLGDHVAAVRAYGTGVRTDPLANVYAARDLRVQRGNWSAWPVCGLR